MDELGFEPQKKFVYNTHLPYSDLINKESVPILAEIKGELGRSVEVRDIKYGASHWSDELTRYIRVYGFNFSKEDHILFIKLLFELITIPDIELSLLVKFSGKISALLKKKELLTRDDLVLPWRPIYKLCEDIIYSPYEPLGLQLLPTNIESSLKNLIKHCREYFPLEATQEMLDEWRPLLCPFDVTIIQSLNYLVTFLPTNLPTEHQDKGYKLWFEEFWEMYNSYKSKPSWENALVSLFSRLATDNIGHIDWTPYVPVVFTRILRGFNLPVGSQDGKRRNTTLNMSDIDMSVVVTWIIAMIGPDKVVLEHINKLFKALQTFYHPSNMGPWILRLTATLTSFPKIFVRRINRERYLKLTWEKPVPDAYKLSDEDVTYFVESLKSCVFLAMFGKVGSQDTAVAIRYLAVLRPELVIPPLMEKMYPAMETLIEPHRLISCINCMVSVARPMLTSKKWYPEGPSHVLPLLNLALPGLDPNDFKKTLMTFQMISTFCSLIPIVDCSEAVHVVKDLTEQERETCLATAQFEDFVLLFLDRIFTLIESSAQETTSGVQSKLNVEQNVLEMGLTSTAAAVFQQCSLPIYKSALKKVYNFITTNVYETKVSGQYTANLCRAISKARPDEALKLFLPHFCDKILMLLHENEDIINEEHADDSLLWNVLMLSQLVRCDGKALLPYSDQLTTVLQKLIPIKCQVGSNIVGRLLNHILKVLTQIYPIELRSISHTTDDKPFTEYLPIRDWGKPGDLENLNVQYHVPSDEEIQFAENLFKEFLVPEIEMMKNYSSQTDIDRELLSRKLNIVFQCITGAGCVLPVWQDEVVKLVDTNVSVKRFVSCNSPHSHSISINGENSRKVIAQAARHMLGEFMKHREDDTKNLKMIIGIYEMVLMYHGTSKTQFDGKWKSFHLIKLVLADKLRGKKNHIRAILIDRIQLQHEIRLLHASPRQFTVLHRDMLLDVFNLAISHYSEVRKKSQTCLQTAFQHFSNSYQCIIPALVANLKDTEIPEHKFKGSLYTILNPGNLSAANRLRQNSSAILGNKPALSTKRIWQVLDELWPALIQAQQSEKPTVLKVIDNIVLKTMKNLDTLAVSTTVTKECINTARNLLLSTNPKPTYSPADETILQNGVQSELKQNQNNLNLYLGLINKLADIVESGKLTWKFVEVGMELILLLLRHDIPAPPKVVNLITKQLINDSLYVRKVGMAGVSALLKQQKRQHKMVEVNPYTRSNTTAPPGNKINVGDRPDNSWHLFDCDNIIDSEDKWNNAAFVEKTHWGYNRWPKKMMIHAPPPDQPEINRSRKDLSETEVIIYDYFQNPEFIDKLISFLSLEENKGRDKFRNKYLALFKGLFRNYGICMLDIFKAHIERLVTDTSHDKQHSSQRCGMEILAGVIRAAKHWSYKHVKEVWDWIIPVLKTTMNNCSIETVQDWATFYSSITESRDPRKLSVLYDMILSDPFTGEGGAFGDSSRLVMILNSLIQQEWRVPSLLHKIYDIISPHLSHQYKSVRDVIGKLLANILLYDYRLNPSVRSPNKSDFISSILPRLEKLKDTKEEQPDTGPSNMEVDDSTTNTNTDEERKESIRLCKTVLKFLLSSNGRAYETSPKEIIPLLPVICALECETTDDDLVLLRKQAFNCLSHALLEESDIPAVIDVMKEVTGLQSWHARKSILRYIQKIVFDNFFLLDNNADYKQQIQEILFHLICDEQLEVREMASVTLSGLLHCGFFQLEQDMMDHFEHLRRTKVKKRKLTQALPLDTLIKRHAGVLGLSACVQAYPYDVPEFVPQILMDLSVHVNDPQPIQLTVKKTLSDFRRTHHDNWLDHKQMFTDDQLVILTDLLISPNYYA